MKLEHFEINLSYFDRKLVNRFVKVIEELVPTSQFRAKWWNTHKNDRIILTREVRCLTSLPNVNKKYMFFFNVDKVISAYVI